MKGLSIILPVYNVESFVEEAIESILHQTEQNFELIIVDDGSEDKSTEIIKKKYANDSRVRYFRKENGGLSSARNYGLKKASGEYIFFLDSDDYLSSNESLKELRKCLDQKPDIVIYNANDFYEKKKNIKVPRDYKKLEGTHGKEVKRRLLHIKKYPGSAWTLCCSSNLIQKYNLTFEEGIIAEDIEWNFDILQNASKISITNSCLISYRRNRHESITSKRNIKNVVSLQEVLNKMFKTKTKSKHLAYVINSQFRVLIYNYGKHYKGNEEFIISLIKNIKFSNCLTLSNNLMLNLIKIFPSLTHIFYKIFLLNKR